MGVVSGMSGPCWGMRNNARVPENASVSSAVPKTTTNVL